MVIAPHFFQICICLCMARTLLAFLDTMYEHDKCLNYYKHDKCQTLVSVRTWRAITIHTTFIDSSSQWHQIVLIVQQALIRSSSNRFLPVLADSQLLNVKVLISVLQLLSKRLFESHLWKLIMKSDSNCNKRCFLNLLYNWVSCAKI